MDRFLEKILNLEYVIGQVEFVRVWIVEQVLVVSSLAQIVAIAVFYLLARWSAPKTKEYLDRLGRWRGGDWIENFGRSLAPLALPVVWLVFNWVSSLVATAVGWPHHLVTIANSMLTAWFVSLLLAMVPIHAVSMLLAWIVIRLFSSLIRNEDWSRGVAFIAWAIAALNILNLLDPTIALLDAASFSLGNFKISALTFIKGVFAIFALLWLASFASDIIERQVNRSKNLTPSVQVLINKVIKILLIAAAIVLALDGVGIDLSVFTVFTGALGLGIGFGLQKSVSNLISGVMILMDKSIKPGDVIEVGESYGWINRLGARYVSVVTRDGIEHLIPNEELITQRVANWSHSDNQVRLKIPIGIAYGSDFRKAMELCLKVANETERVLDQPEARCLLKGLGDSSVDLELRIWINDPANGVSNVKSAVLSKVVDQFAEHGIPIPFPQLDLHVRDVAGPADGN